MLPYVRIIIDFILQLFKEIIIFNMYLFLSLRLTINIKNNTTKEVI